jgi:hypothetical protein
MDTSQKWFLAAFGFVLIISTGPISAQERNLAGQAMPGPVVRVYNYAQVTPAVVQLAKKTVNEIFGNYGIQAAWVDCLTGKTNAHACSQPPGINEIALRLNDQNRGVKAGSLVGGLFIGLAPTGVSGMITVYYRRVEEISLGVAGEIPILSTLKGKSIILGYVIAHEIGHLLLPEGHSSSGIMKKELTSEDWRLAATGSLQFNPEEGVKMQRTLREETTRLASK